MSTLLEAVQAALVDVEEQNPEVTAVVYDASDSHNSPGIGSPARAYLTRRASATCGQCGLELAPGRPGPLTAYDFGAERGFYSREHEGCGYWNSPVEVFVEVDTTDGLDDVLAALLAELDDAVESARVDDAGGVRDDLLEQLRKFLPDAADRDHHDPTDEPGIYWDFETAQWAAWDYDPRNPDDPSETITVYEGDVD